jgi:hypothetical protein
MSALSSLLVWSSLYSGVQATVQALLVFLFVLV